MTHCDYCGTLCPSTCVTPPEAYVKDGHTSFCPMCAGAYKAGRSPHRTTTEELRGMVNNKEISMKPICFYHKADLDGVCSAAIVKHFVPDCELYGIDYGDEFPWDKVRPGIDAENDPLWADYFKPENGYKTGTVKLLDLPTAIQDAPYESVKWDPRLVYTVDFSLPPADMKRLAEVSELVWIDHHKTAIDACHSVGINPSGLREVGLAGCELTWMHMSGTHDAADLNKLPEAVRLLGRYDVWDKDDPEWDSKIMPFQYGMRSVTGVYSPTAAVWDLALCQESIDQLGAPQITESHRLVAEKTEVGIAILRYQATVNRSACEAGARGIVIDIGGGHSGREVFRALCCNTTTFNSRFFDGAYDPEIYDVMCAYAMMANRKWKVSLYTTRDDIDCGAICKSFGGGGHRKAAGFMCTRLPWDKEQ